MVGVVDAFQTLGVRFFCAADVVFTVGASFA
jgi:hypothetical protein